MNCCRQNSSVRRHRPGPQYFYDDDYATILEYMGRFQEIRQGPLGEGGGKAIVYRLPNGTLFVFGQHETGPEFILDITNLLHDLLRSVADGVMNVGIIFGVVRVVFNMVKKLSAQKYGKLSGVHDKGVISIEARTTRGAEVLRTVTPHADKDRSIRQKSPKSKT